MKDISRFWVLVFVVFLTSCVSKKDITYFQDTAMLDSSTTISTTTGLRTALYEPIIRPGDILNITIISLSAESNALFNFSGALQQSSVQTIATPGYLVDIRGNIQIPLVGDVHVADLTTSQIKEVIKVKLEAYLLSPTVNVRFSNFKITLLGDVTRPGVYPIPNERVTLLEALGMAGDLTIFGERKEIKLVRDEGGVNKVYFIDLTSQAILKSPYLYLQPNDVIYVNPGRGKIASSDNTYRILSMVLTAVNIAALVYYRLGR